MNENILTIGMWVLIGLNGIMLAWILLKIIIKMRRLKALRHPAWFKRIAAARSLGESRDKKVIGVLLWLLAK